MQARSSMSQPAWPSGDLTQPHQRPSAPVFQNKFSLFVVSHPWQMSDPEGVHQNWNYTQKPKEKWSTSLFLSLSPLFSFSLFFFIFIFLSLKNQNYSRNSDEFSKSNQMLILDNWPAIVFGRKGTTDRRCLTRATPALLCLADVGGQQSRFPVLTR